MKKAFITGITGFSGTHLSNLLLEKGYSVSGTYLSVDSKNAFENKEKVELLKLDLLDKIKTHSILESVRPDYIYHLAALASPRDSFKDPSKTFYNNITGEINILESIKDLKLMDTKILIISSAEIYGRVKQADIPMNENTPMRPTNPYAVSKIAQDYLGLQYFLTNKINVVRVRPFNHVGPGQSPNFVVSAFAKKITDVENGKESIMKIGNLKSKRDFTDVRDMVKAYYLALEKGEIGDVYNLGSGKSYQISEILDMMIKMSSANIITEEDPTLMMPSDDPEFKCDYSKFNKLTSWNPEIPIEKTLEDTLEYWRKKE